MCFDLKSLKNSQKRVQFLVKFHLLHKYVTGHFLKKRENQTCSKINPKPKYFINASVEERSSKK